MLIFSDAAAIAAAPTTAPVDDALRQLITDRVHDWTTTDLLGLTVLLILEADDNEESLVNAVGYSPLINPLDGKRFGRDADFEPAFDWLHQIAGGWYELIQTVSNDGFALVILLPGRDCADPQLLTLCRAFADWPRTEPGEEQ